jgi:hypothetical protein
MTSVSVDASNGWRCPPALVWLLPPLVALLACGLFLPHQSIWIDESTQLSGLTLDPIEVVRWLTGTDVGRFGVPHDRMPPVSYWLGIAWSQVFGHGESSFRWMGAVLTAATAVVVTGIGRRVGGANVGLAAGLLFAVMPNTIVGGVEIRTYPLFLLVSAIATLLLLRVVGREPTRARDLAWLSATLVVAVYTHYYGVVLAFAVFAAALLVQWQNGRPLRAILIGGALTGALSIGLLPFVLQSVEMSREGGTSVGLRDLARMFYRLYGHPAVGVSTLAIGAATAGVVVLVGVALRRVRRADPSLALFVMLCVGLGSVAAAGQVVRGFNAYASHYNSWAVPAFVVWLCVGLASHARFARRAATVGYVLVLVASVHGAFLVVTKPQVFAHGPHATLAGLVEANGVDAVEVLIDTPEYGYAYFPLRYAFGRDLRQFHSVVQDGTGAVQLQTLTPEHGAALVGLDRLNARTVLVVNTRHFEVQDLAAHLRGRRDLLGPGPANRALAASPRWRAEEPLLVPGLTAGHVQLFRAVD